MADFPRTALREAWGGSAERQPRPGWGLFQRNHGRHWDPLNKPPPDWPSASHPRASFARLDPTKMGEG
jgi:hypothetical protein